MKIVNIAYSANGGAGRSAYRLHESFVKTGLLESFFLSIDANFPDDAVNCHAIQYLPSPFYKKVLNKINKKIFNGFFSKKVTKEQALMQEEYLEIFGQLRCEISTLPFGNKRLLDQQVVKEADIINLHWVANGLLDYPSFFKNCNKPIIWTLHDMNAFMGLFHYREDEESNKSLTKGLDQKVKILKQNAIKALHVPFEIVTPSLWLAKEVKDSIALKSYPVHVIPYSLDYNTFYYRENNKIRDTYNIRPERIVFVFIAQHIGVFRKGFDLLYDALKNNPELSITIIAVGNLPENIDWKGIDIRTTGMISDNNFLAEVYSAADAFVLPSREDNLPNVMLESFACGTPVIGFPVGGIKQYVLPEQTGLLAEAVSSSALYKALSMFFEKRKFFERNAIMQYARNNFNEKLQATRYFELYNKVI